MLEILLRAYCEPHKRQQYQSKNCIGEPPLAPGALPGGTSGRAKNMSAGATILCALASLLFIPPGSLAPPCNTAWGSLAWLAMFCASALLAATTRAGRHGQGADLKSDFTAVTLAGATIAAIAWTAWRRGLPGSPLNFGTFAAMPLWRILDIYGTVGFCLLMAGLVLARPGYTDTFDARLRRLTWCCVISVIFVPNPSSFLQRYALMSIAGDYIFFWIATVVFFCLPSFQQQRCRLRAAALCCFTGVLLLFFALHKSVGIITR